MPMVHVFCHGVNKKVPAICLAHMPLRINIIRANNLRNKAGPATQFSYIFHR